MIRSALGCADNSLLQLTDLSLQMWGRNMIISGQCIPQTGTPQPFKLESIDCRETKWQLFSHHAHNDPIDFPTTDIVSLKMGQSHHRKSASILTDHFGLTWNYETLNLRYGEIVIELE